MEVHIFCALPSILSSALEAGVIRKARDSGALQVSVYDLHELSCDPHKKIDDSPYGGGPGMVLRVDVIAHALERVFGRDASTLRRDFPVILLTPQGEKFTQEKARLFVREPCLCIICGRYEGTDDRVRQHIASIELSIGDYVLSGGELAAAVIVDAVARLLPGVLGNRDSLLEESFSNSILEYPQYTRPAEFRGWKVPEILLSGDHERIRTWRKNKAIERTMKNRPELLR